MNNKCKYLKQKLNRKLECKKDKNRIPFKDCKGCSFKESESNNNQIKNTSKTNYKQLQSTTKLKNKSNKLAKLEKNRFSLFTNNKDKCMFCSATTNLTWHEIFRGRNRVNSMKYGLCLRMCLKCHVLYQEDPIFNDLWHKKGQVKFNKTYPDLDFIDIFKINYLDKE